MFLMIRLFLKRFQEHLRDSLEDISRGCLFSFPLLPFFLFPASFQSTVLVLKLPLWHHPWAGWTYMMLEGFLTRLSGGLTCSSCHTNPSLQSQPLEEHRHNTLLLKESSKARERRKNDWDGKMCSQHFVLFCCVCVLLLEDVSVLHHTECSNQLRPNI